jgi:hypothetical protein
MENVVICDKVFYVSSIKNVTSLIGRVFASFGPDKRYTDRTDHSFHSIWINENNNFNVVNNTIEFNINKFESIAKDYFTKYLTENKDAITISDDDKIFNLDKICLIFLLGNGFFCAINYSETRGLDITKVEAYSVNEWIIKEIIE